MTLRLAGPNLSESPQNRTSTPLVVAGIATKPSLRAPDIVNDLLNALPAACPPAGPYGSGATALESLKERIFQTILAGGRQAQ
jgi:hypothetical protein